MSNYEHLISYDKLNCSSCVCTNCTASYLRYMIGELVEESVTKFPEQRKGL
jgi:hypothetical protein